MSIADLKMKEVVFECESENEALQLLNTYKKNNFHLVSRKIVDPKTNSLVIKLIKFKQSNGESELCTVWENFVHSMGKLNFSNSFIAKILTSIRTKSEFWTTHPNDHFKDLIMDQKNFVRPSQITKTIVFVGPKESLETFWCTYQKTLRYFIKDKGLFCLAPRSGKSSLEQLSISSQVKILDYNPDALNMSVFESQIKNKVGIVFVDSEQLETLSGDQIEDLCAKYNLSLILSTDLESKQLESFKGECFLAASYDESFKNLKKAIEISFLNDLKIAFLWSLESLNEISNPQKQVLDFLDKQIENDKKNTKATIE